MDPESGSAAEPGALPGLPTGASRTAAPSVIQRVLQALIERLGLIVGAVTKGSQRSIGVENRFYFDKATQQWKLEGETEQDRLEAEALRFHTSRGMSSEGRQRRQPRRLTRAEEAHLAAAAALPPPPTGGPVTTARNAGAPPGPSWADAALCHPVEAPGGLGLAAARRLPLALRRAGGGAAAAVPLRPPARAGGRTRGPAGVPLRRLPSGDALRPGRARLRGGHRAALQPPAPSARVRDARLCRSRGLAPHGGGLGSVAVVLPETTGGRRILAASHRCLLPRPPTLRIQAARLWARGLQRSRKRTFAGRAHLWVS
ncbi:unnamed protein product [Prorocentrum cordatum]|uniref:Non-specific serine/threonine protein kinase n=1 Tax=Prorocentrum cordatum TaxID=2364126 RepID=A0ABN9RC46_9DINO|nr:unnamed protein product [Polarella glacialis]